MMKESKAKNPAPKNDITNVYISKTLFRIPAITVLINIINRSMASAKNTDVTIRKKVRRSSLEGKNFIIRYLLQSFDKKYIIDI